MPPAWRSALSPASLGEDGGVLVLAPRVGTWRGLCRSSVCPEVIAAAVWPPGAEVIVAAAVVGGEPPGVCCPAGSPMWRLFVPAGVEPEFRL
jgi:hypothetical protein